MKRQVEPVPRVALFVDTSTSWGRSIVQGVHHYTQKKNHWHLFVEARGVDEFLRLPEDWEGDGIIARISDSTMAQQLEQRKLPVVNVSGIRLSGHEFPRVTTNLQSAVRMAANHLLDRGLKHFAYFSQLPHSYVEAQQAAFVQMIERAGLRCALYRARTADEPHGEWALDLDELARWLLSLPKPVGILTWNASSGRQIIHACQQVDLNVPDEVAVLSGADDDLLCEVSNVPMSGLTVAAEQIGYEAARMLDGLMRGKRLAKQEVYLEPLGVATRQSTETLAIEKAAVAKAIRFVRDHAATTIRVSDVVNQSGLSRRTLERQFQACLGRTIADEIRRVHLDRAKQLLTETDLPIPEVAHSSGFASAQYMIYTFQKVLEETPLRFRKRMQHR